MIIFIIKGFRWIIFSKGCIFILLQRYTNIFCLPFTFVFALIVQRQSWPLTLPPLYDCFWIAMHSNVLLNFSRLFSNAVFKEMALLRRPWLLGVYYSQTSSCVNWSWPTATIWKINNLWQLVSRAQNILFISININNNNNKSIFIQECPV